MHSFFTFNINCFDLYLHVNYTLYPTLSMYAPSLILFLGIMINSLICIQDDSLFLILFCINENNFVSIKRSNILKWCQTISMLVKRVCEWWLFNRKWEIFQMHHAVASYIPRYDDNGCLVLDQHASFDLSSQIVLTGYFVLLNTITHRSLTEI